MLQVSTCNGVWKEEREEEKLIEKSPKPNNHTLIPWSPVHRNQQQTLLTGVMRNQAVVANRNTNGTDCLWWMRRAPRMDCLWIGSCSRRTVSAVADQAWTHQKISWERLYKNLYAYNNKTNCLLELNTFYLVSQGAVSSCWFWNLYRWRLIIWNPR